MERIAVVGSPGAGKSTLARQLGDLLKIEVTHLDHYFWKPGWRKLARKKRISLLQKNVQKERWIIEGCYHEALDTLLNAADTIIFLDIPRFLCFYRVIKRYFTQHSRPDLPRDSSDTLRLSYIKHVWQFPQVEYFYLKDKVDATKNSHKVIRLSSKREVANFVRNCAATHA